MGTGMLIFLLMRFLSTEASNNVVLILADDLDLVLDGMTPLKNTVELIGKQGRTYDNSVAVSPICCPNRASILTGMYMHNHYVRNNSISGNCSSLNWQTNFEQKTFASIMSRSNYTTFYAGKYLNQYGSEKAGGVSHVPPGWDHWYGLVGNSKYYDYSLSINGKEKKYGSTSNDYLTDVLSGFAKNFISQRSKYDRFLMVIAPPAPHAPFTPANRHYEKYKNVTAKRTDNFNKLPDPKGKHWLVRKEPTNLPDDVIHMLDRFYQRRWETLLAVDEMVLQIYETLKSKKLLDETYIIFTSDNGYHIGQFGQPIDKRQPYETDIRVPFLIRGPNIKPKKVQFPISSVDMFATMMDIADLNYPSDGSSILQNNFTDRTFLIEYEGEGGEKSPVDGCPEDNDPNLTLCNRKLACKCQDSTNNTFTCIRRMSLKYNNIFCLFKDDQNFVEYYDLNQDPFQLHNLAKTLRKKNKRNFKRRLLKFSKCSLDECRKYDGKPSKKIFYSW